MFNKKIHTNVQILSQCVFCPWLKRFGIIEGLKILECWKNQSHKQTNLEWENFFYNDFIFSNQIVVWWPSKRKKNTFRLCDLQLRWEFPPKICQNTKAH